MKNAKNFIFLSLIFKVLCSPYLCVSLGAATENTKLATFKEVVKARSQVKWEDFSLKSQAEDYAYFVGSLDSESFMKKVTVYYYSSLVGEKKLKPLLLIFPGIGGVSYYDHYIAKYFVKKGFHVAISHTIDVVNSLNPRKVDVVLQNNVLSSIGILDALTQFEDIDQSKIGLLGSSYGGIRSSFLLKVEDRISAAALVVASSQFAKILSSSDFFAVNYIKKSHMQQLGVTSDEQYEEYINNKLPFEPHDCFNDEDYSNHLIFSSKLDAVVPAHLQDSYVKLLKNARHIRFDNLGHIGSLIWFVAAHLPHTYRFFCEKWGEVPIEDININDWNSDDLEEELLNWH